MKKPQTQYELLQYFQKRIANADSCSSVIEWIAIFMQQYAGVRNLEIEGLIYEMEQKLEALTGETK